MNERIKELVNAKFNGSILAFSKVLDMPQTSVNAMISGKMKISQKLIVTIATTFPDLSAEWLLRGKGAMLLTDTPKEETKKETRPAPQTPAPAPSAEPLIEYLKEELTTAHDRINQLNYEIGQLTAALKKARNEKDETHRPAQSA